MSEAVFEEKSSAFRARFTHMLGVCYDGMTPYTQDALRRQWEAVQPPDRPD